MAFNEIIYRHGDKLPIFNAWYELDFENAPEVLEGTDDPGACVEREKIYIRLDKGDPKETLIHEIQEAVKYEMLETAKDAIDTLIHKEGGDV